MKYAITTILLLTASAAYAEDKKPTEQEACKMVGTLAGAIMKHRQAETPMSTLMATLEKTVSSEESRDAVRKVIILAYQKPGYRTEENKQNAIDEFVNQAELVCYSG